LPVLMQRSKVKEKFGFKAYESVNRHFRDSIYKFKGCNLVFIPYAEVEPAIVRYRSEKMQQLQYAQMECKF